MSIDAKDFLELTTSVTKKWTQQRKAEEKGNKSRESRGYVYSDRVFFTEVADAILPGAYQHASGNDTLPAATRQIYYACREQFKERTGRDLDSKYFSNVLLRQYMNRHPEETSKWKVTADPRGKLIIPNAGHEENIPCGTLQIAKYLKHHGSQPDLSKTLETVPKSIRTEWPSLSPGHRYQGVLYIEKEGFEPLFQQARIAERFDIAILSCKGQSVVAARRFADEVCYHGSDAPLFIAHDCDKSGFEISLRLTKVSKWAKAQDRVAYTFLNEINAIDIGLRLADAKAYKLASERVSFEGGFAEDSICTPEEKAFLRSGRRVELNAFTSPQFIEWLETKLTENGLAERLIPDDEVLTAAYRRAMACARINLAIEGIHQTAMNEYRSSTLPETMRSQLEAALKDPASGAWDEVLYNIAKGDVGNRLGDRR